MTAKKVFLRTAYNYDTSVASKESGLRCVPEGEDWTKISKAWQSCKDECDINEILRRFGKTGLMPVNPLEGTYGDFSDATDYQTAMNALIASEREFDALPSNIRKHFNNDPYELVKFVENPDNFEKGVELGIFEPKTAQITEQIITTDTPE